MCVSQGFLEERNSWNGYILKEDALMLNECILKEDDVSIGLRDVV